MKIIRLTESDLTNIVKKVIKENSLRQDLIQQIKEDGWKSVSGFVGGFLFSINTTSHFKKDPICKNKFLENL